MKTATRDSISDQILAGQVPARCHSSLPPREVGAGPWPPGPLGEALLLCCRLWKLSSLETISVSTGIFHIACQGGRAVWIND